MEKAVKKIAENNDLDLLSYTSLVGGDINQVYWLKTDKGEFVVKCNDAQKFPGMFEAEQNGLNLLHSTYSFKIPKVITSGQSGGVAYLLMEYLSSAEKPSGFWMSFGEKLAQLHKTSHSSFGLDHDNYIGSLPQYNSSNWLASEFYIEQRLKPQFQMAINQGYDFADLSSFYTNISSEIPDEPSSLIHGDLWSGNYMVSINGDPVLIDPAVAYAPREMDLAMMRLFGGFSQDVFDIYSDIYPLVKGWKTRIDIWQLYYLLVHLNLFGGGYFASVNNIVNKYS